jgi:hypothetical protein
MFVQEITMCLLESDLSDSDHGLKAIRIQAAPIPLGK